MVSAFNKSKCQTESEVLFNPLLLIHAKRYGQPYKKPLTVVIKIIKPLSVFDFKLENLKNNEKKCDLYIFSIINYTWVSRL